MNSLKIKAIVFFLLFVGVDVQFVLGASFSIKSCRDATTRKGKSSEELAVPRKEDPLFVWMKKMRSKVTSDLLENISRPDGSPGAIVAALTRSQDLNYYYHWVRDAAIVIEALVLRYKSLSSTGKQDQEVREEIIIKLNEYIGFSQRIQSLSLSEGNERPATKGGLGEPKFEVTGQPFEEEWGRPQNDSPASRAISMMKILELFREEEILEGEALNTFLSQLYDPSSSRSLIKVDLEYTAQNWRELSYDIWEEVPGLHFYTLMIQRRALLDGAELAKAMGDTSSATRYENEGREIEGVLTKDFYDSELKIYRATKKGSIEGGFPKTSEYDIAFVLGLLYGGRNDGFMPFSSERVQSTLLYIEQSFRQLFPINDEKLGIPGAAIGRYHDDMFSGVDRSGGNPWVLATLAMAEAYFRLAFEIKNQGTESNNMATYEDLIKKALDFVDRVKYHSHDDGSTNEQINRVNGYMTSVEKLTWNVAQFIRVFFEADKFDQTNTTETPGK